MTCRPCEPVICDLPNDLATGGGIFPTTGFTFIFNCPPGFFCFVNQQTIRIPPNRIPPVIPPPVTGENIILRLQGCLSEIVRILPGTATAAQIAAAAASMQAEWAAQQAICEGTHGGNGGVTPPAPPPRPIGPPPIDICGHLKSACVGAAYSGSLSPCGPNIVGAFQWTLIAGSLPPGIIIFQQSNSRNLFFGGTPTLGGRYVFTIRVTDNFSHLAQRTFVIGVIEFSSGTPPDPLAGQSYTFTFTVVNGTAPYTFTVGSGTLPDGLTLSSDGVLSGTPTNPGQVSTFAVCVTDSA